MKYKIKEKEPKKAPDKMFVIFPRYCGKCMVAYWMMFVPAGIDRYGDLEPQCPCHGTYLWISKSFALRHKD